MCNCEIDRLIECILCFPFVPPPPQILVYITTLAAMEEAKRYGGFLTSQLRTELKSDLVTSKCVVGLYHSPKELAVYLR